MNRVAVLLVEDHPVFRLGLVTLLEGHPRYRLVAAVGTIAEARASYLRDPADVILADLRLPDGNALDLLVQLRREGRDPLMLILTVSDIDEDAHRALRAGALGYLNKSTPPADLLIALERVADGQRVVDQTFTQSMTERASLTERELEVLGLVVAGRTNPEIGLALSISLGTVRTHVSHILEKLGAASRAEATAIAIRRGLV